MLRGLRFVTAAESTWSLAAARTAWNLSSQSLSMANS